MHINALLLIALCVSCAALICIALFAVRERVRRMQLAQLYDRQAEWLAYAANPSAHPAPEPLPDDAETRLSYREYDPDQDHNAVANLYDDVNHLPDFWELAPERDTADVEMINSLNAVIRQFDQAPDDAED